MNEVMFELSKMERIVEKSGAEYFAAVPRKVEKISQIVKLPRTRDEVMRFLGGNNKNEFK